MFAPPSRPTPEDVKQLARHHGRWLRDRDLAPEDLVQEAWLLLSRIQAGECAESPTPQALRARLRGAMRDAIRAYDWTPRSVRRLQHRIQHIAQRLLSTTGWPATPEQMAEAFHISLNEWYTLEALAQPRRRDERSDPYPALSTPPDAEDIVETHQGLREAYAALRPRTQAALRLYYAEGYTLKQIGQAFAISESGVCLILRRARTRLRGALEAHMKTPRAPQGNHRANTP